MEKMVDFQSTLETDFTNNMYEYHLNNFFCQKTNKKNISIIDWHFYYLLYAYERRISFKEHQFTNN